MALPIRCTNNAADDAPPASRGYAWLGFALTFGLMV